MGKQAPAPPAPDIDRLKEHSPDGDPLIEAIRRRGTSSGLVGTGYPEENAIAAEVAANIEDNKPNIAEQAVNSLHNSLQSPAIRITARALLKLTNARGKIINPTDTTVTDQATGRIRTPTGAATRLAGQAIRFAQGLTGDAPEGRELKSPLYLNVIYDPFRPSPVGKYPGGRVFDIIDLKTRHPKPSEVDLISIGPSPSSKNVIKAAASSSPFPSTVPRSSYVWNGVIGRSADNRGFYSTWMEATTLLNAFLGKEFQTIDGFLPTAVALIKAKARDRLPAICKQLCYQMGYPIDFYLRRAAPLLVEAGFEEKKLVFPTIAFRSGIDSFSSNVAIDSNEFAAFGRMQSIPVWTGQNETFSVNFTMWCTNRAEMVNNREQIAWMLDMLKPEYSNGEIATPGGWAYLRVGDLGMHGGEQDEMLVFVDSIDINVDNTTNWESTRKAKGIESFQHPFILTISISGRRILKKESGATGGDSNTGIT